MLCALVVDVGATTDITPSSAVGTPSEVSGSATGVHSCALMSACP